MFDIEELDFIKRAVKRYWVELQKTEYVPGEDKKELEKIIKRVLKKLKDC